MAGSSKIGGPKILMFLLSLMQSKDYQDMNESKFLIDEILFTTQLKNRQWNLIILMTANVHIAEFNCMLLNTATNTPVDIEYNLFCINFCIVSFQKITKSALDDINEG